MTDTFNNTIQSPPPKRRRLAGTMSSSTPSLQPSALDHTRSFRKPTSTARLMKDSTTTGAVGTSASSSANARGTGIGAPKQRPISMIQMPSTTKGGALAAPGTVPRTVVNGSMTTAVGGSGIRMASVTGNGSGTNNSNIKPPASGGLNRLASTRLKREGVKPEDSGVETGAKVGTGIPSGAGGWVGSGAATTKLPSSTSIPATKSTTSTISGLKQPQRARAPAVSATSAATRATPLSPPTATSRSVSGSFGMARPTTSSSSDSIATITSLGTTATSDSGTRIGTGIGIGGRGHARTQSTTISLPKPTTPKPGPRSTGVSGTSATPKSSLGTGKGVTEVGRASKSPRSVSKGVPPPSTPGKSRPQSLISTNVLRRSPATATPKAPTRTGGTPNPSTGTGPRSPLAHKRTDSAASVSTTGTTTTTGSKARTAGNPGMATSTSSTTATTQNRRLAASKRPLSLQPPKPVSSTISKPAPTIGATSSITRPTATAKPLLRQPNPTTASSSSTITKTVIPKPRTHFPGPALHTSTSSQTSQHPPHHDHDFDTYQQHYTPAKVPLAPKPLTSTFLAPPTPSKQPANVAASAETSRLQTELLQLHLLYRDAERIKAEWEGDAQKKLRERWESVRKGEQEVGEVERVVEEEIMAEGLLSLLGNMAGSGSAGKLEEEKIQTLDEVISGVWAMSDLSSSSSSSGSRTMGKYVRVVRRFEVWAERAGRILEERRRDGGNGDEGALKLDANGQVEMVGAMDVEWKNECVALGRRLEEWRRMLRELGGGVAFKSSTGAGVFRASRSIHGVKDLQKVVTDPEEEDEGEPSALDKIMNGFGSLVNNMLAELEIMEQIEREAVAEENAWVRKMNRVDDEKEEGKQVGAIWRAF